MSRLSLLVLTGIVSGGCQSHLLQRPPASPLEVRYRLNHLKTAHPAEFSTSVYRQGFAKSMFSRCKMVPHDSQYFALLLGPCGGLHAVVHSAARLFLERSATTDFLQPVRIGDSLQWLDLPGKFLCEK